MLTALIRVLSDHGVQRSRSLGRPVRQGRSGQRRIAVPAQHRLGIDGEGQHGAGERAGHSCRGPHLAYCALLRTDGCVVVVLRPVGGTTGNAVRGTADVDTEWKAIFTNFLGNGRAVLVIVTSLSATTKVSGRNTKINEITARGVGVDGRENWSRRDPLGSRSLDTCGPFNYQKLGRVIRLLVISRRTRGVFAVRQTASASHQRPRHSACILMEAIALAILSRRVMQLI